MNMVDKIVAYLDHSTEDVFFPDLVVELLQVFLYGCQLSVEVAQCYDQPSDLLVFPLQLLLFLNIVLSHDFLDCCLVQPNLDIGFLELGSHECLPLKRLSLSFLPFQYTNLCVFLKGAGFFGFGPLLNSATEALFPF